MTKKINQVFYNVIAADAAGAFYAEQIIKPGSMDGTHMGGDRTIMDAFVDAVETGEKSYVLTPVEMSLDSHLMAFAAEESRLRGETVDVQQLLQPFREDCMINE